MTESEFYENIENWIKAEVKDWTHITLLAYFCHKYEKKNGVKFRLVRAAKGPTMGKEAADFAKLFRTLAPENYKELDREEKNKVRKDVNTKIYNYINWMFDYKFRSGATSVNGTRIFLVPSIINDFERMYNKYLSRTKTEDKIQKLINWCKENTEVIFKYHQLEKEDDLKILKKYADQYQLTDDSVEKIVIAKAMEIGIL